MAILIKYRTGEIADVLRWSQTVIDWADGDPAKGNLIVGSPLAVALVWRGTARFWLGRDGWRQDLDDAVAMARSTDPVTYALVVFWKYGWTITNGVLVADDTAVCELDEALQVAEESGDDTALGLVKYIAGYRAGVPGRRSRPSARTGAAGAGPRHVPARAVLPERIAGPRISAARERARRGDRDGAIPVIRKVLNDFFEAGQLAYGAAGTAFLVEALLDRGTEGDVAEAQSRDRPCGEAAGRRRFGVARHHAAAAARPGCPGPRRRRRLPGLGGSLSRDGGIAWLRRTYGDGQFDDVRVGLSTPARGKCVIGRECLPFRGR